MPSVLPVHAVAEGLGFAKPRNVMIDFVSDNPLLRKMVLRFSRVLWPTPEAYGYVMAFAETGRFCIRRLRAISLGWLPKEKWRLS